MNKKICKGAFLTSLAVWILAILFLCPVQAEESVNWEVSDFTYGEMEQTLNGCDYTRQFKISGPVVSGFSESGEEKLKQCTDLVLPAVNENGEKLVGVADNAFKEKGLTSVKFPEGMMVDYDDTVTNTVTKRGNYIIGFGAFFRNNLTEVDLPEGVIAVMSSAFKYNQLTQVTLPHTIWWIENSSFSNNELETVGFPKTTDFQVEIHAFAFSQNKIKSVTLPYYTEVVEKKAFYFNPGMEPCGDDTPENEKGFGGIVYMYSTNPNLLNKERIHHYDRTAETQHSWHQKLFIQEKPAEENEWTKSDFTYDGTTITGLSESGINKRKVNPDLVLPDTNTNGNYITALADSDNGTGGLFATSAEKFETVDLPLKLQSIGKNAFADAGLKRVKGFPATLETIGMSAFRANGLTVVVLPDTVTSVGEGAFATNPKLEAILLSKGLTTISSGAFGCSDNKHYMTSLTEIEIPNSITTIQSRGFAGNNFHNIMIPESVTEIGDYAFSTKNYLSEKCQVTLPEGLKKIGKYAFRNKVIYKIDIPESVQSMGEHVFLKEYSDGAEALTTRVYMTEEQKADTENIKASQNAVYLVRGDSWNEYDFTYEKTETGYAVSGLSETGLVKVKTNHNMQIPSVDVDGNIVTEISENAFKDLQIEYLELQEGITEIGSMAFASNNIKAVQLTDSVTTVKGDAFYENTGVEDGIVYLYSKDAKSGVEDSAFQKLIVGQELPDKYKIWCPSDFQYSADGTTIIGFSEAGKEKVSVQRTVRFPAKNSNNVVTTEIASHAFENCGIEEIVLPAEVKIIGECAFAENSLKELTLPNSVTDVGENAFAFNNTLKKITVLSGMATIPNGFAEGSNNLLELELPNGIQSIGDRAFLGNKLPKVVIPDTVQTIGASAFEQNNESEGVLKTLILGSSLVSVGEKAFANTGVTEVDLPKSVNGFAKDVFYNTFGTVVKVYVSDNKQLDDGDSYCTESDYHKMQYNNLSCSGWTYADFLYDGNVILGWSEQGNKTRLKIKELVVPEINPFTGEILTEIGEKAFRIPYEEVEQLKDSVESPNGMITVQIPESIEKIENNAFEYNSLKKVEFPKKLSVIGNSAFHGNRLTEVSLPDSVTIMEDGAFSMNDIVSIKLSKGLKQLNSGIFSMNIRLTHIDIPEGVTEIGATAFAGDRITSLEIPSTVTKIGRKAFHLHHIKELTIPGNVKEIGESAFEGTFKAITLKKLVLEEGVETIGPKAFKLGYLESVKLPSSLKSLSDDAFVDNAGTANDHVVILYTNNKSHLTFPLSTTHKVVYTNEDDENVDNHDAEIARLKKSIVSGVTSDLNVSKKTMKICFRSLKEAHSYQIQYRLNGKSTWKTVSVKSNSYTLKNLKKGTVIEIRVRGLRSDNGKTTYSKFSSVKRVFMNSFNLKSVKGAKKAVVLKWSKQSGTNGYQISYASNKDFSKAKTVTLKNSKTTGKTLKVSKQKTYYYVKIRSYRKLKGKTYFGAWSKVKKVRSK